MLFSSLTFIFAFLPLALAAVLVGRRFYGSSGARFALTAASLLFYGLWGWKLLPVLILVAGLNYRVSYSIARSAAGPRKRWLVFGIAANLLILIAFKYTNFLIDNLNAITGFAVPFADQKIRDRKSTRLNSSHTVISYAVFCLTKKTHC